MKKHQIGFKCVVGTGNEFVKLPERGTERLNLDEIIFNHRPKVPVTLNFTSNIVGSAEISREDNKIIANIILADTVESIGYLQMVRAGNVFGALKLDNVEVDGSGNISGIVNSVGLCGSNVDKTIPPIKLDEPRCPLDKTLLINAGPLKGMGDEKDNYCCSKCHRIWIDIHSDEWSSRPIKVRFKKEPEIGDKYEDIIEII